LINKFLDIQLKDDIPATFGLEYKNGYKLSGDKRVKSNVYELGGGRNYAELIQAAL